MDKDHILIGTGDAIRELNINRLTLYKWIKRGVIHPMAAKKGKREFYVFLMSEIERVKKKIKTTREAGKTILKGGK